MAAAFLQCVFVASFAQNRPKVGLALSGGGARGLAHIGVLQALEKAGIKIDYIAGTSMGAVIGGLYAIGYSADSIEKIALSENWDVLLANQLPLNKISIEEKNEYDKYISEFVVKNKKFQLPNGLIQGQELTLELSRLFMPVYTQRNFKKFNIPFACMATDISSGRAVVLDTGNIVRAVRASMAIPSVFTPVEINGKLLVDGGIVYNFPVDIVKKMGADIVIGIDISEPLRKKTEVNSIIDVLLQINSFADLKNYEQQKKNADILVTPTLTGYSGADFAKGDSIVKCGKVAGERFLPVFAKLKDSLDRIAPSKPLNHFLPKVDTIRLDEIKIVGSRLISEKLIRFHLQALENAAITAEQINNAIKNLFGTRYFNHIHYEIIYKKNKNILKIYVEELPEITAKFALNYHSFLGVAVILNSTFKNSLWSGSRFMATINIGNSTRFRGEFLQYIGKKHRYYFQSGIYGDRLDLPIYIRGRNITNFKQSYFALDARVARLLGNNALLTTGIKGEHHVINPNMGIDYLFERANYTDLNFYLLYQFDNTDKKYFPTRGIQLTTEINSIFWESKGEGSGVDTLKKLLGTENVGGFGGYRQYKLFYQHHVPLAKRWVAVYGIHAALTDGANRTIFNDFSIGGMIPLYRQNIAFAGLWDYEIFSPNAVTIKSALRWEIFKSLYLTGQFNVGSFEQSLDKYTQLNNVVAGGALSLGFNSFIGPVQFTVMQASTPHNALKAYVNVGYNF